MEAARARQRRIVAILEQFGSRRMMADEIERLRSELHAARNEIQRRDALERLQAAAITSGRAQMPRIVDLPD